MFTKIEDFLIKVKESGSGRCTYKNAITYNVAWYRSPHNLYSNINTILLKNEDKVGISKA